jgi:hypothetical protein
MAKCLISQLPGLLMMGYLRPAQANAIRSALETILRHHHQAGSTSASALNEIDIMSILHASGLVNLFGATAHGQQRVAPAGGQGRR